MLNLSDTSKNVSMLNSMASNTIEKPLSKIIEQIVSNVKYEKDYNTAMKLILENNLKLEDLVKRTSRIRNDELIKLANMIISLKQ